MAPPKDIKKYKFWLKRQIKSKKGIKQSKKRREITRKAMNRPETKKNHLKQEKECG